MMKKSKLFTLIKYFVTIDFFAILSIRQNLKIKGKKSAAFQGIISLLFIFALFFVLAPKLGRFFATNLNVSGSSYLTTFSVGLFIVTLFFSLATSFVFIEKNNETEMLLSLPISGSDIFLSRIYSLAITFFLSFFIMFIIAFGVMGYTLGKSIEFYIFTFLGLFLLNLETVLLNGVIILIFGKLIRTSKLFNRFLKFIYAVFGIGIFAIYMILVQTVSNNSLGTTVTEIVKDFDGKLSKIFFFVIWIKKIILSNNIFTSIINLLIGLFICLLLSFILKFFAQRNYLEILRSLNVISKESKAVIEKRKKKGVSQNRQYKFIVLFKKEFLEIISTPTYLMQIVIIDIMLIFASCVGFYYGISVKTDLTKTVNLLLANVSIWYMISAAFGIGAVLGLFFGFSSLTTSSVSREGKSFWILASAPIGINTHIISRIFACQALHFVTVFVIMLLSLFIYIFNPICYIALLLGMGLTLFTSGSLNMILGLISPYFDWKTPKEALNGGAGGMNVFISVLINYGVYALIIFTSVKLVNWKYEIPYIVLLDTFIVLLATVISYLVDVKLFKRLLKRL